MDARCVSPIVRSVRGAGRGAFHLHLFNREPRRAARRRLLRRARTKRGRKTGNDDRAHTRGASCLLLPATRIAHGGLAGKMESLRREVSRRSPSPSVLFVRASDPTARAVPKALVRGFARWGKFGYLRKRLLATSAPAKLQRSRVRLTNPQLIPTPAPPKALHTHGVHHCRNQRSTQRRYRRSDQSAKERPDRRAVNVRRAWLDFCFRRLPRRPGTASRSEEHNSHASDECDHPMLVTWVALRLSFLRTSLPSPYLI